MQLVSKSIIEKRRFFSLGPNKRDEYGIYSPPPDTMLSFSKLQECLKVADRANIDITLFFVVYP